MPILNGRDVENETVVVFIHAIVGFGSMTIKECTEEEMSNFVVN